MCENISFAALQVGGSPACAPNRFAQQPLGQQDRIGSDEIGYDESIDGVLSPFVGLVKHAGQRDQRRRCAYNFTQLSYYRGTLDCEEAVSLSDRVPYPASNQEDAGQTTKGSTKQMQLPMPTWRRPAAIDMRMGISCHSSHLNEMRGSPGLGSTDEGRRMLLIDETLLAGSSMHLTTQVQKYVSCDRALRVSGIYLMNVLPCFTTRQISTDIVKGYICFVLILGK